MRYRRVMWWSAGLPRIGTVRIRRRSKRGGAQGHGQVVETQAGDELAEQTRPRKEKRRERRRLSRSRRRNKVSKVRGRTLRRHFPRARMFLARHGDVTSIVLITAILYSVAWPTLQVTHEVPAPLQPLIAALAAFPFLLVRANPAVGWCVSAGAALVIPLAFDRTPEFPGGPPWQVVHIIVLLVLFAVVCLTDTPARVAGVWAGTVVLFAVFAPGSDGLGWAVGLTTILIFMALLRRLWLSRRQLATQEEQSRLERSRRAVLEERARIARDLHDVVAHHMSLVVVQAQTAQYRVGEVSSEAAGEFDSIAGTAREALNEVRAMLGVLRSDEHTAERAPQPGIDRLGELVDGSRRAGVDVAMTSSGDTSRIRTATGVVLYRIVQESLSNATRHAPGSRVRVTLRISDDDALVEVVNGPSGADVGGGPRAAGPAEFVGGNGIRGMRERAYAVGGELTVGPEPAGGFAVRCRVPMDDRAGEGMMKR